MYLSIQMLYPWHQYIMRYIDYGNYALLKEDQLAKLGLQLRVLRPQAFKCSILSEKHSTLSEKVV